MPDREPPISAAPSCERCGAALRRNAPGGLCPACLLESGLKGFLDDEGTGTTHISAQGSTHFRQSTADRLRVFGDYELIEEIARGGMGVVYKARQLSLNRIVAVKMILVGQWASEEHIERFQLEAEAAANLDHPGIVPIYEIGEFEGQHYFSMKLIEGGSLATLISRGEFRVKGPKGQGKADIHNGNALIAKLVAAVAHTVHYAHQRGVLHRDLKPTNILIDAQGQPHLTDFGLAKVIQRGSSLTHTAAVLGTPGYMAPEQAAGQPEEVTVASDVYGLGAILYELLAGRPPFQGETPMKTLRLVLEREPTLPRLLNPNVPSDLETICLKCLQKDQARRYGSAEALAQDLERWLEGEPILARRVGQGEKVWRWARRNPVVASLSLAMTLTLLAVAAGSTLMSLRLAAARDQANQNARLAQKSADESRERLVFSHVANWSRLAEEGNALESLPWLAEALDLDREDPAREKLHRMRLEAALSQTPRLLQLWSDHKLLADASFSADGKRVAIASLGGAQVWDIATGEAMTAPLIHRESVNTQKIGVRRARFSPDGTQLLTTSGYEARLWNIATGEWMPPALKHERSVVSAEFSADGKWVVTASVDETARVWSSRNGELRTPPLKHEAGVLHAEFSLDGTRILTACRDGTAKIWNAESGERISALRHGGIVEHAVFSPDGRRVATAGSDSTARLWDAQSGQPIHRPWKHRDSVKRVCFSPDGRRVVTGGLDRAARIWDAETGEAVTPFFIHKEPIVEVSFSSDGQYVVTASDDNTSRVWDASNGAPATPPLLHNNVVVHAEFSSTDRLLTASTDGTVRVWELPPRRWHRTEPQPRKSEPVRLGVSHDGQLVLTLREGRWLQVMAVRDGATLAKAEIPDAEIDQATFSFDKKLVILFNPQRQAWIWDFDTQRFVRLDLSDGSCVVFSARSPDGKRVITSCSSIGARVWDLESGKPVTGVLKHDYLVEHVAYSSDGRLVATASKDGTARVWNPANGDPVTPYLNHADRVTFVAFSPDNHRIVTTGYDGIAQVWDVNTGKPEGPALRHPNMVYYAAFSPDGKHLVTARNDKMVQVWDIASGTALAAPLSHGGLVQHVEFSPDLSTLTTITRPYTVRLWEVTTGLPITIPPRHPRFWQTEPWISRRASEKVKSGDEISRAFQTDSWAVSDLALLLQLYSGRKIDGASGLVPVDTAELSEAWKALRAKYPSEFCRAPR